LLRCQGGDTLDRLSYLQPKEAVLSNAVAVRIPVKVVVADLGDQSDIAVVINEDDRTISLFQDGDLIVLPADGSGARILAEALEQAQDALETLMGPPCNESDILLGEHECEGDE
jgi:hypothetical protein